MSSISTNYSSYLTTGLSYLLGSSSTTSSLSSSSTSDSSDELYDLLKSNLGMREYDLTKDSSGKAIIPTVDQMNNATSASAKLTLASGVAQGVLIQADASSRGNNATRVTEIATQAKQVLNAVSTAVSSDASLLSKSTSTISKTLSAINNALTEVENLKSSASTDTQKDLTTTLSALDELGCSLAKKAGVSWTSVTGNASCTTSGTSASSSSSSYSSTSNLIDILA